MAETKIRKTQIEDEPFDGTTGHTHDGTDGNGPLIESGASALSELTDVNVPSPTNDQVLAYDTPSGKWTAQDQAAPVSALDDLSDVEVPTPDDGQLLTYNDASGKWRAQDPPGTSSIGSPRNTDTITTSSLAYGTSDSTKLFDCGKCCAVLKLATNKPAWVRVYSSVEAQAADAGRAQTEDPVGEHGVLLECITTADNLSLNLAPAALVFSADYAVLDTVCATVTNLDAATGSVIVTLTFVRFEG
jgi:hypothetical protein